MVINWYRQNKASIPFNSGSFDLYRRYMLARFSKKNNKTIDGMTEWRFYNSLQDYCRFYRQIMHKKIQIDYYSIDSLVEGECTFIRA